MRQGARNARGRHAASGGSEQAPRRSIERCRRRVSRVVTYIITVQCHYANVCRKALCIRTYAYEAGGSRLHIIRGDPRLASRPPALAKDGSTHVSVHTRHFLLKLATGF